MKIAGKNNNNMAGSKTIVIAIVALAVVVAIIVGFIVLLPDGNKEDKGGAPVSTPAGNADPGKIEGISIDLNSTKTLYYIGEDLELDKINILVSTTNKANSYSVDGNDPDVEIYGFVNTEVNENLTLDVSYKGKTTSFVVSVLPVPEEIQGTVTGFSIISTPQSVYDLNEALDITKITLSVTVKERSEPYIVSAAYPDFEVSGFDSSAVNDALEIVITYKENTEITQSYFVIIRDKANYEVVVLGLNIVNQPKLTYNIGESFDPSGMKVQVETQDYTSDYFLDGNDPRLKFTGFDSTNPAENQVVTITYEEIDDEGNPKVMASTKVFVTIKSNEPAPELLSVTVKDLKTTYTVEKWNKNKLNIYGAYWEYEYENGDVVGSYAETPLLKGHVPSLPTVEGPCELEIVLTDNGGNAVTVKITITAN